MTQTLRERLETAVVENLERGVFQRRRDIFTDVEMFDLATSSRATGSF